MTIQITRPETEILIQRYLKSGRFRDADELIATAIRALPEPVSFSAGTSKNLIELLEPVRELFADAELDFSRTPSLSRPVDLS
jgi:Arc/MetJ-type ribon-helix-helix transcriptional regulator